MSILDSRKQDKEVAGLYSKSSLLLRFSFAIWLFLPGQNLFANTEVEKSSNLPKATMGKNEFFGRLRIELRKSLCAEGGLTDCFSVEKSSCEAFVTEQFSSCQKAAKTGERVSMVGEDLVVAESIGLCISERFSRKFQSKFKESNECKARPN